MAGVKASFDRAAETYDRARRQLVPGFDDFYGAVFDLVPHERDAYLRVLDLGAGTGLLSALVGEAFPNARITLVDFSEEMLEGARLRFARDDAARFGFRSLDYAREPLPGGGYAVVVSALSIHHLEDRDKKGLFRKVYEVLREGGVFVNADQVLGATPEIEERYHAWWLREARGAGVGEGDLAASLERIKEDRNATLEAQMAWLGEAGFVEVDCPYKNRRFAVYGGRRPRRGASVSETERSRTDG